MKNNYAAVLLAAFFPCLAIAQDAGSYQCSYGELQRRVQIFTEPGVSVPCEVHYYKDTEAPGERQVLWSATNEEGFCERKTEEFIAKLQSWGWECGQGQAVAVESEPAAPAEPAAEPAPAAEPEPAPAADDTEALAPVEEAAAEE